METGSADEAKTWQKSREIIHFTGICGAGKSTLSKRIADRIMMHGGKVIGTIDYDPHVPDHERAHDRAFSRELDRRNMTAGCNDPAIHEAIVEHALESLSRWVSSDADVVLVDRWVESYDGLRKDHISRIENAIVSSGFRMKHVLLTVGGTSGESASVKARMLHTRGTRPPEWWNSGPASLDEWVQEEVACQNAYREFIQRSPFESITIDTTDMEWSAYEAVIVDSMLHGKK
ncbi:hypothetical protein [Burkholderia gladioli]|uniref:hypothetical protein n=1 Tax=Burkholderia gladioli TaxID=28095 RepID=UPI00163EB9E8|nr:hypothetical protein [Burkholderia gladioli]